ncbi:hypothetical protein BJ508DRAFT_332095 [Ascobolus immersus RN42]|uniref:WH2 domain-containing protein n=1 Tax=Ascobolus immersus RN42 TaxID=1160509 RepID=A0A3N4HQ74_ASCIM|nr:hypothetical protein BJ508DRAFT_332095 [Ascobolus immersus RN42]
MQFTSTFLTFVFLATTLKAAPLGSFDIDASIAEKHASIYTDSHLLNPYISSHLSTRSPDTINLYLNDDDDDEEDINDKTAGILRKFKSLSSLKTSPPPAAPPKSPTPPPPPPPSRANTPPPPGPKPLNDAAALYVAEGVATPALEKQLRKEGHTGEIRRTKSMKHIRPPPGDVPPVPPIPAKLPEKITFHDTRVKRWSFDEDKIAAAWGFDDDEDDDDEDEDKSAAKFKNRLTKVKSLFNLRRPANPPPAAPPVPALPQAPSPPPPAQAARVDTPPPPKERLDTKTTDQTVDFVRTGQATHKMINVHQGLRNAMSMPNLMETAKIIPPPNNGGGAGPSAGKRWIDEEEEAKRAVVEGLLRYMEKRATLAIMRRAIWE